MLNGPCRHAVAALLLVLAWLMPGAPACAQAVDPGVDAVDEDGAPAEKRVEYVVVIEGAGDGSLHKLMQESALLVTLKDRPPASLAALEKRAIADLERLDTVLRSEAYYAGKIDYRIDKEADPPLVTIAVDTGPAYRLSGFEILYTAEKPEAERPTAMIELGLTPEMAARAPAVRGAERLLLRLLGRRGFPFAAVADRRIVVDHDTAAMNVTLTVDSGPLVSFGPVRVEGAERVETDYVLALLAWREGERYDAEKVQESEDALRTSNLFSGSGVEPGDRPAQDGPVEMLVTLRERPPRSIGGGVSWSTNDGFLGELFWEHRNLAGRNETLRLTAKGGELEQSASANLAKPNFLRPDQTGRLGAEAAHEDTDAYEQYRLSGSVGLDREIDKFWRGSASTVLEYLDIRENDSDRFLLLSVPFGLTRDDRDSILNPTKGTRLDLTLTPSAGTLDHETLFLTLGASLSAYFPLDDAERFVLAGRLGLGTILGAATDDIPASKRLYAGGGGSVRGYGYQLLGPLDAGNDPIGGRSRIESGLEMRIKITDEIGIVPFVDGGTVQRGSVPDLSDDFRVAVGLGVRYYTSFAPLRLDVAFPLDRRRGVDDSFQFYVSIGQAF